MLAHYLRSAKFRLKNKNAFANKTIFNVWNKWNSFDKVQYRQRKRILAINFVAYFCCNERYIEAKRVRIFGYRFDLSRTWVPYRLPKAQSRLVCAISLEWAKTHDSRGNRFAIHNSYLRRESSAKSRSPFTKKVKGKLDATLWNQSNERNAIFGNDKGSKTIDVSRKLCLRHSRSKF